jgi:hypothetical protein
MHEEYYVAETSMYRSMSTHLATSVVHGKERCPALPFTIYDI